MEWVEEIASSLPTWKDGVLAVKHYTHKWSPVPDLR
jgi:hypothetical protein